MMKTRLTNIASTILLALVTSAYTPAKDTFTPAEQQQISIPTPGLFTHSNTISIDLSTLKADNANCIIQESVSAVRGTNSCISSIFA